MFQRKNKKKLIIAISILALVTLSLGYAMLTRNLKINGNANISKNTWDIYFDNVIEKDSTATINNNAVIHESLQSDGKTAPNTWIDYNITLNKPTDKYDFIVDIVNDGSIDAMIDEVRLTGIEDISNYVTYSVKYLDGTDVKKCDLLKSKSRRKVRVITTFKDVNDESELPGELKTSDIKFQIDYIQAGDTCDGEPVVDTLQKHKLTIKPNGGIYGKDTSSETTENIEITLEKGEEYNLLNFVRDGYELVLDLSTITEYNETSRIITMGESDIEIKADWNIVDLSDVVAKNVTTSKYYPTIKEAFDEAKANEEILLLKDTEESPINNTVPAFKFDLGGFKITGTLTNNGNITLYNGTIENESGTGAINTGTLTLGINDETVLVDEAGTIAIIGSATAGIGLQNTGTFNFYDGYLEAKVGLLGKYDEIPVDYYVYVNHNDVKNCQKVHLTQDVSRAVAKTINEGQEIKYFNLQDAFNSGMEQDLDVYAIRDFEASYELHIDENEEQLFDLLGWTVRPGNDITNNGTFTITDTGRIENIEGEEQTTYGELMPSKTITNNGTLNVTNAKITETTSANVITNNKDLNINNATITAATGYGIYNTNDGHIAGELQNTINANYAIYNNSTDGIISAKIKALGTGIVYNTRTLTLDDKAHLTFEITRNTSYGIKNEGSSAKLYINGGSIDITNQLNNNSIYGIYQDSSSETQMNDGTININCIDYSYGIYSGKFTMNGGTIDVETTSGELNGIYANPVVINDGTIKVKNNTGRIYGINSSNYTINGGIIELESLSTSTSYETYVIAISGNGTINNNPTINSSRICVSGNTTINGGTFNCGTYGVVTRGSNVTMTDGTINAELEGIYSYYYNYRGTHNSTDNIYGGTIISKTKSGIYYSVDGTEKLTIGSKTLDTKPYIEGATSGVYATGYLRDGVSNVVINKGNIVGKTEYGTYTSVGIVTGEDDGTISKINPSIKGETYGLYIDSGLSNFYDGIVKGKVKGYYGTISGFPDGAEIIEDNEVIDNETYNVAYLESKDDFIKVGDETFNSFNKAYEAIESEGTMELIASADITSQIEFPNDKNITIDLAGKTLNMSKQLKNNSTLKITDSSTEKNGTVNCNINYCLYNTNSLTIEEGTYNSEFSLIYSSNELIINGGLIDVNTTNSNIEAIYIYYSNITINGGTIKINATTDTTALNLKSSMLTMNDGLIDVNSSASVYGINGENVIINGGKIAIESTYNSADSIAISSNTIKFYSGEIDAKIEKGFAISSSNFEINGGIINVHSDNESNTSANGIEGSGSINNNPVINASYTCIEGNLNSYITINGGTLTCGGYGILGKRNSNYVINDGTISSKLAGISTDKNSHTYVGININGGRIISSESYGVDYYSNYSNSSFLNIGNNESETYPYIEGKGGIKSSYYGYLNVYKGEIIGRDESGIETSITTNMGFNDENVSISTINIRGKQYGLNITNGITNIYDGIFKGEEAAINGNISGILDGYTIKNDEEIIEGNNYQTAYLITSIDIARVGDNTYNSLNKAITAIEENGTIEIISSANIQSEVTIPTNKNITLDLAGFSLQLSKPITNNGKLTIIDSSNEQNGTISCGIEYCLTNNAIMTINGGNYNSEYSFIKNNKNLTINEPSKMNINAQYGIYNDNSSNITINGGDLTFLHTNPSTNGISSYFVYFDSKEASANINGGTIKVYAINAHAIGNTTSYNSIEVTGGNIYVEGSKISSGLRAHNVNVSGGEIIIKNTSTGQFEGSAIDTNTFTITGGNIELDSASYYDSIYLDRAAITGGGTISGNPTIKSTNLCGYFNMQNTVISGGTFTCDRQGIYTYDIELTINGGTINSKLSGIYAKEHNYYYPHDIKITGGKIISEEEYGVYYNSTNSYKLIIGEPGGGIDTTHPHLQGASYGIYNDSSQAEFYDGILKGQTAPYYGTFSTIEENALEKNETEIIDEAEYHTAYLITQTDIVKNTSKTDNNIYNNLQTAIDEAASGDNLELIDNASIYYAVSVPSDKTINLNMNGYSITTSKTITNSGKLKIDNSDNDNKSRINCSIGINLIQNSNELSMSNVEIKYTSNSTLYYEITNDGLLTITNSNISNGQYGIKNNSTGILNLNNTNITAQNTAVYNYGELHIDSGNIEATSYAIYNYTNVDNDISNSYITSQNNVIYKYSSENITTITDTDLIDGQIYNGAGTTNINNSNITGIVDNRSTMIIEESEFNKTFEKNSKYTVYINNNSNMTFKNSKINSINNDNDEFSNIYTTGTLNISDSEITTVRDMYTSDDAIISGINNNGGIVNSVNNTITINDETYKQATIHGITNNDGTITTTGDTINMINAKNSYGLYINSGDVIMETGQIESIGTNAYGIILASSNANLTLGTKDGSGLETADVSITNPEVKAIGTTIGVGVKNNNGTFNFYDGKLIGNTYAKPETANEVEPGFEARYFLVHDDDTETEIPFGTEEGKTYKYEYSILEFLK